MTSDQRKLGVPILWNKLKPLYPHREFIENPHQRGFGIGLLQNSAAVELPPGF